MGRPTVLVYRPVDETGESHRRMIAAGCELVFGEPGASKAELAAAAPDAAALLGATFLGGVMDRGFLAAFPELRIVAKYTIGIDDVDLDAATEAGILVTHSPTEANWGGVAEGTIAFMLNHLKKVRERDRHVKAGGWRDPALQGRYVGARADGYPGLTIGLVGLGRIGRRVADLLAPWRVRLLACDPYVEDAVFTRHGATRCALEPLIEQADVVSLHCSLTPETRGLVGAEALARMRADALLVNTARGALVDVEALCDALEAGRLGGAALDVLPEEPPPPGARILGLGDRVTLCPHMAAANEGGTLSAAVPWATEAVLAALEGRVPEHVCNAEAVPLWRSRFGGRALLEPGAAELTRRGEED